MSVISILLVNFTIGDRIKNPDISSIGINTFKEDLKGKTEEYTLTTSKRETLECDEIDGFYSSFVSCFLVTLNLYFLTLTFE